MNLKSKSDQLRAIPDGCEEAVMGLNFYVPCNRPAVSVIRTKDGHEQYRMCEMCADHSVRNRGMILVGPYAKDAS